MDKNIIDKLLRTQVFVTLPPIAMKILEMIKDENKLDIKNLAKIVETDVALTSQIIRVSNSPLFATRAYVQSVLQAIINLGLNRLTNIVFGILIFSKEIISGNPKIIAMFEKYRWHSSSTAAVSKSLASRLNLTFREYEFIGGLLHDMGKLALIQYDFEMFEKVLQLIEEKGMRDVDAELEIYGVTHNEVGFKIAEKWNLPEELAMVLMHHTNVLEAPPKYKKLVATVHFASMLCGMWEAGFYDESISISFEETPEYKILNPAAEFDFEQITFELETDFRNSQEFLDIIKNEQK